MTIQCLSDLFNRDNYKIDSLIRLSIANKCTVHEKLSLRDIFPDFVQPSMPLSMLRSFCPPLSESAGADDLSSADYTPHRAKSRV